MAIWLSVILAILLTSDVHGTNLAHTVFLPSTKSLNPFGDSFAQQVATMNRKQLSAVPVLSDEEFLRKFILNDKSSRSSSISTDVIDPYASILDNKIDDQLAAQDAIDSEWVYLMTSGPLAINYVSNLLVVASRKNFPLARPQNFSFQYIKYPDSFQATLAQVSGSMYAALMDAHTTMDRVQLTVKQIPSHIKTTLNLMLSGSPKLIDLLLPKNLESIGRIANESALYARQTYGKFSSLQDLIGEVIEASTYAQSTKQYLVDQIKNEIKKAKLDEQVFNDNLNTIKSQYASAQKEMERARQEYRDAYNAIPTRRFVRGFFKKIWKVIVKIVVCPWPISDCIFGACCTDPIVDDTTRKNAIARANLLLQVLQEAEKRYAAFAEQHAIEQQKLVGITQKLAALDLSQMSEEDIIDILYESLVQMNKIKVEWEKLIQFFSKLSVQADSIQQIVIHELIGVVKDALEYNILLDPVDREFFVEMLSVTLKEVERVAHLLFIMSKTYYDVSSEYMINQIAGMNALIILKTDAERSSYLQVLNSTTTTTSAKIIQLGQQRHYEYSLRNKARRQEFQEFLAKVAEE